MLPVDKAEPFLSVTGHSVRMDWVAILAIMALSNSVAGTATEQLPAMLDGFDQVRSLVFETGRATPSHVTMRVTDQLTEARIRASDGTVRDLPRDQPTRRTIELTLTTKGWRISAVRQR